MKFNIENYEQMTPEEKVAALEAYEPDMSGYVSKSVFDKTAADVAAYKKQLRDRMTEDEVKEAKAAEDKAAAEARTEELEKRIKQLEEEKTINTYTTSYIAMGYDEKLAKSSAEALAKGDTETVFKNQKIFSDAREKALRTELLKETPKPASGNGEGVMTKDAFAKLNLIEKQKFAAENPEEYKALYATKEE